MPNSNRILSAAPARPTEACYWIIGARNNSQAPAAAVDLHTASGNLACETMTFPLPRNRPGRAARRKALAYAKQSGIGGCRVSHDRDSTDFFGRD